MKKSYMVWFSVIIVLLIALIFMRSIVFGGATPIQLNSAPALTGQISQALASSRTNTVAVYGKDYKLDNTIYFENKTWVVTNIVGLGTITDGVVVMNKQAGIYQVVLGPGSSFASTSLQGLPSDVAQYLNQKGLIYEPIE